jgi:hypothetical protein
VRRWLAESLAPRGAFGRKITIIGQKKVIAGQKVCLFCPAKNFWLSKEIQLKYEFLSTGQLNWAVDTVDII